jgi:hypothetical protein
VRPFRKKVLREAFLYLDLRFVLFGAKISAQKLHVMCWWNWLQAHVKLKLLYGPQKPQKLLKGLQKDLKEAKIYLEISLCKSCWIIIWINFHNFLVVFCKSKLWLTATTIPQTRGGQLFTFAGHIVSFFVSHGPHYSQEGSFQTKKSPFAGRMWPTGRMLPPPAINQC